LHGLVLGSRTRDDAVSRHAVHVPEEFLARKGRTRGILFRQRRRDDVRLEEQAQRLAKLNAVHGVPCQPCLLERLCSHLVGANAEERSSGRQRASHLRCQARQRGHGTVPQSLQVVPKARERHIH